MNAQNPTRARVFRRSLLAMACAVAAAPAFSQTAAPAAAASAPESDAAQQVVVSGSRIKHDNFSTPAPVQIIKADDAALSGITTIAGILQSTAVTGGQGQINNAFGGYVTDGGPGSNTIGLRGLSPTRTLVLLNGRRLSPSGTRGSVGAPDLNTLPASIVDRIEILKDGASSIYGSDAIAGVINIITKKDLSEITVDGGTSQTQHGGGNTYNFSVSGGLVTDHAHFLAAYSFEEQQQLTLGQRGWASCNNDNLRTVGDDGTVGTWGSADFIDPNTGKPKCYTISGTGSNGVTINTLGTSGMYGVPGPATAGTVGTTKFTRWRPNSGITQDQAGANGLAGYEGVSLNSRDTFDKRMLNESLLAPVKNHNAYLQGGVDIPALGDTAEAYWELMFNRRESSQVGYRQLALDYAKGSPLIPSNLAFSTVGAADNITNGAPIGVRAFIGTGNDHSDQSVNFTRAVAGLKGTFSKINWDYDISLTHSESRGTYTFDGFEIDKLANSLNVVSNGAGGFNCVSAAAGCVAAPAVSSSVIGGKLPAAWLNYVFNPDITGVTKYKEDVVTASTTGDIYALPYGKIKGAFGAEFRRNFIDDKPSDDMIDGNILNFTSAGETRGSDQAKDLFGEVEVPVLKDLPFAHELTLTGSLRRSDYKSYGAGTTHKFGGLYAPFKWLSVRGTMGTSYRAPALFEQYVGSTTGFLAAQSDPCDDYAEKTTGNVAKNCAAEGLPADFRQTNGVTDITKGGRDAGLKAETSKNNSWGVILQPDMPTGWGDVSFAFDHYNIDINNGISQIGATNILNLCYDDATNFQGPGSYCRLLQRDPNTHALTINDSYINVASALTRGNDYTFQYTNNVGIGKLQVRVEATQFLMQATKLFATDPWNDTNGAITQPKWSGAFDLNYTVKNWGFHWGTEVTGKMNEYALDGEDSSTSQYRLKTATYLLHSASVSYADPIGKWKATLGVRNLADRNPPSISTGVDNRIGTAPLYSGYDLEGRTFFMSVSKSF